MRRTKRNRQKERKGEVSIVPTEIEKWAKPYAFNRIEPTTKPPFSRKQNNALGRERASRGERDLYSRRKPATKPPFRLIKKRRSTQKRDRETQKRLVRPTERNRQKERNREVPIERER
jgi:hypothetical protein